jgi:hypothetical protein
MRSFYSAFIVLALGVSAFVSAQVPGKPTIISGEVTAIDASRIKIHTKDGNLEVTLADKTEYKRVSAEKPSLATAAAATLGDIAVGDKVAISVVLGDDKKPQPARTVYLMTKSDIAQRHAKESEEWRTRGITGRVVSVDALANKITIEQRGFAGGTNIVVTPKEGATFLRYAPDSVKFSEARPSTISEVKPGDMMRALGDRGADGTTFTAEELVSGAFQTRAGTVKSIDEAKNEIVVTDLQSKKDLTIAVLPNSVLKKFPEEMAQRMAGMQAGGQGGFRPGGQPNPNASGAAPGQNPGGPVRVGPGGGGRGGAIDDLLDRFPDIKATDLKVGDVIAVSSTRNGNLDRIAAIKLLSGVEPFLRAAQAAASRQSGPQRQLDLNIPGLDGFGTP